MELKPASVERLELASGPAKQNKCGRVLMNKRLTAVIQREDDGFVAYCPELDIASQGDSIQSSRDNLREALELFFECASPSDIDDRLGDDVFVTHVEVTIG